VSEDVMLLAAFSKLTKLAWDWFDLDTGTIDDSWSTFKIAQYYMKISSPSSVSSNCTKG